MVGRGHWCTPSGMHEILKTQGNVAAQVERAIPGFVPPTCRSWLSCGWPSAPRIPERARKSSKQAALGSLDGNRAKAANGSVIAERIGYAAASHPGGRH